MATNDIAFVLELIAVVLRGDAAIFHFVKDLARVLFGLLRGVRVLEVSLCGTISEASTGNEEW